MKIVFSIFLLLTFAVDLFCQENNRLSDFGNYQIVKRNILGYLPANSENLPILVKTGGDDEYLSKLYKNIEFWFATEQERRAMEMQGGVKYAYLDNNQNFVVPFGVYDYADVFGLGRKAIVANKGKYGIIDEHGELVLPLEYDLVERPSNYSNYANIFVATKRDTVTILDENVSIIPNVGIVSYLHDRANLFVTNNENKKGLIDYNGKQIIPFLYDTLYQEWSVPRIPGYIAKKDGFYGFVSRENEIIQPFKYNYIYAIDGKVVYVDQNNKVGIFNEDGSTMIPFEYDAIHDTYYNRSVYTSSFPNISYIYMVEKDGKIGTIDDKNNVIIPIIYDGLSGWVEYGPEDHFVKNNGKYGIISPKGEIVIPIEYDYVGIPQGGVIDVRKNGKYGVVSSKNIEILPCIYDKLILDVPMVWFGDKPESKIIALQQNIWNYYDLNGKLLQSNVPLKEISDKYDYILRWDGELSSESYDYEFDFRQKGGLEKIIFRHW